MPLLHVVVILVIVGFALWLINNYIPMQPPIKQIVNGVVILAVLLWLASLFGIFEGCGLKDIRIGR